MDQYSHEFIAEKARLRPADLGLVRTARRSHNQLGLAYQIAFIRLKSPWSEMDEFAGNLLNLTRGSWCRWPPAVDDGKPLAAWVHITRYNGGLFYERSGPGPSGKTRKENHDPQEMERRRARALGRNRG